MKKTAILLSGAFLLAAAFPLLAACEGGTSSEFDPDANLDTKNVFFDDFTEGVRSEYWNIGNSKWGTDNGGVLPENVKYTEDGILILQCNGDNYVGELRGHGNDHGRRTGAQIISREYFGPGRFEVRMKCLPRFGSTTAFWTYYNNGANNYEIDIELNVEQDFTKVWNTNWLTLEQTDHYVAKSPIVNNDGEWHTYKFEWHTNPARIDYYIDDVLTHTSQVFVPDVAMPINIGNWFPSGWAGSPDFETDYTFVDWFRYTPYLNNDYTAMEKDAASPDELYPAEPVELPVANLISNAQMESDLEIPISNSVAGMNAWRQGRAGEVAFVAGGGIDGSSAIEIKDGHSVYQYISGMHESFELTLRGSAKTISGSGRIVIECMPLYTQTLQEYTIEFSDCADFTEKSLTFTLPEGTQRLRISLEADEGSDVMFDNLFCNLTKKMAQSA